MTVGQLIAKLNLFPNDIEVVICDSDEGNFLELLIVQVEGNLVVLESDYDHRIKDRE
jgi:hypothetical protein